MSKIYDALRKAAQDPAAESPPPEKPRAVPPPPPPPAAREEIPLPPPAGEDGVRPEADAEMPPLSGVFSRELANLRASLEQTLDQVQRTVVVAGSVPGEGASTVAARFSQFLGEDPRLRVALIDADMRNADPRPVETVEPGYGLAAVLSGVLRPGQALRPTGLGNLDVLPSEGVAGDPYALCTADHVDPLLDYLRGQYHYAVLDAAPVLSAPETALLGGEVDGVVLVVRAGKTKREVIQRSLDRLRKHRARVLGVVMNRQQYVIPEFIYRRL